MQELLFSGLAKVQSLPPTLTIEIGAGYAALLIVLFFHARRNYLWLPKMEARPAQGQAPDCMVVIPARNEAGMIGRAVRSLPPDSVIVVDDASTDGTVEEAEKAGAGVLRAPALPKNVLGKPHACMVGAKAITSKWILFADADTWYEPGMLESAVQAAERNELSFLSVHLSQEGESLTERGIARYIHALFFVGINPKRCPEGVFCGQCLLVRREAYEFIGGHSVGLTFLMDDVKLALLAQRHRLKFASTRAPLLGHARTHRTWKGLWEGIHRNAYRFTVIPAWRGAVVAGTALLAALWLPFVVLLAINGRIVAAAGLAVLLPLLLLPWSRRLREACWTVFAVYAVLPILANAFIRVLTTKHVPWKGREV